MDANDLECDRFSLVSEKQAIQQTGVPTKRKYCGKLMLFHGDSVAIQA
jgi:hypothetical protein